MKKITDGKLAERIALLEHAEAETGQLSLQGESELGCLRELCERREQQWVLQQKLDALAAENAVQKENALKAEKVIMSSKFDYWSDRVELASAVKKIIETPATDAYLNSVRAEGIEMLADNLATPSPELADGTNAINKAVSWYARQFANRLRSGTHDTADKAG